MVIAVGIVFVETGSHSIPLTFGTTWISTSYSAIELVNSSKENRLPWIPRQQAVDGFSPLTDDLGRNEDEGVQEGFELHP